MDRPYSYHARIDPPDAIRRWATLEGKSATMSDELYRRHAKSANSTPESPSHIVGLTEVLLAALDVWWHVRSH